MEIIDADPKIIFDKRYRLSRHENGKDVIDVYNRVLQKDSVVSEYVTTVYGNNLEFTYMALARVQSVSPRVVIRLPNKNILH